MTAINFIAMIFKVDKRALFLSLSLTLVIKVIELAQPWALAHTTDLFLKNETGEILRFLLYFILLSVVSSALIPWQRMTISNLIEKGKKSKSLEWNKNILAKNYRQLHKAHKAEVIEAFYRARSSFTSYAWSLMENHITTVIIIVVILSYIMMMKIYWILPITMLSALLIMVISRKITKKINPLYGELHQLNDSYKAHFSDLYDNAIPIKLTGFVETAVAPFKKKIKLHLNKMTEISFLQIVMVSSNSFMVWLVQGALLVFASYFLREEQSISTGDILGAYFYSSLLIENIKNVSHLFLDTTSWETSNKALGDLLAKMDDTRVDNRVIENFNISLKPFSVALEDGTHFCLEQKIVIPHGSKVGIVGDSGSGKTLLLDILAGNIYVGKDIVRIGSTDVLSISLDMKSKLFSFSESEIKTISGDLLQSIFFGAQKYDKNTLQYILEELKLDSYIHYLFQQKEFPRSGLSAGEKKRFEIFRNLASKSPIILMDAPRESLNDDLAKTTWEFLLSYSKGSTLICTDHEVEIFKEFDYTIIIDKNKKISCYNKMPN